MVYDWLYHIIPHGLHLLFLEAPEQGPLTHWSSWCEEPLSRWACGRYNLRTENHRPIHIRYQATKSCILAQLWDAKVVHSYIFVYLCSNRLNQTDLYPLQEASWLLKQWEDISCEHPAGVLGWVESGRDNNCTIAIASVRSGTCSSSLSLVSCCSAAIQIQELKAERHSLTVHFRNKTWQNRSNRMGP